MMASDNKHISAPEPKMRPKNFNNSHKKYSHFSPIFRGLGDRLQKPDLRLNINKKERTEQVCKASSLKFS